MLLGASIFSSKLFRTGLLSFKLMIAWVKISFSGEGSLVLK